MSKPTPRRLDIQAMRALAIFLVIAAHAGVPGLAGGYVGVDVFFVLSGYLITTHLLGEVDRSGRVDLGAFFARRVRRILPAALVVVVATMLAGIAFSPPLVWPELGRLALASVLFVPNVLLAKDGTDYLQAADPSALQHLWSLGVEEQFYLIWPVLVGVVAARSGRTRKHLGALLTVGVIVSLGAAEVVVGVSTPWAYFSLPTRAWEFGLGALVAVVVSRHDGVPRVLRLSLSVRGSRIVAVAGLVLIVGAAVAYDEATRFPGLTTLLPVVGAAMVVLAGCRSSAVCPKPGTAARPWFAFPPIQYLGAISFSLYLWHWPLLIVAKSLGGRGVPLGVVERAALVFIALGLSALTLRFVERPFLVAGGRVAGWRPQRTLLAAAGAVTLVGAVSFVPGALLELSTLDTGAPLTSHAATNPPTVATHVGPGIEPSLRQAPTSVFRAGPAGCNLLERRSTVPGRCVVGDAKGGRTVALFGDSHSGHWLAALDDWGRENGVRVTSWTKSGCSAVVVARSDRFRPFVECDRWRENVFAAFAARPPDLVVTSNSAHLPFDLHGATREEAWTAGVRAIRQNLPAETRLLGIADTPLLPTDVPTCLSAELAAPGLCGGDRRHALDAHWALVERDAFAGIGAAFVDLGDRFCSQDRCEPVLGNTIVYRDTSHLTVPWVRSLVPVLGPELEKALEQ